MGKLDLMIYLFAGILVLFIVIAVYNGVIDRSLRGYVAKKERNPDLGVFKGAEPVFLKGSGDRAALLIHGFIGSPADFGNLPRLLHEKGYTVSAPLLPGHGTDPRDFSKTTPEELEEFVLQSYRKLKAEYREVTLIGFSMGGALSILAASREKVDRLILLAPYLRIAQQWYYVLPVEWHNRLFLKVIPYVYRPLAFKQINDKSKVTGIVDYDYVSLRGADTAIRLGNKALNAKFSVERPVLIIHGVGDRATDYRASRELASALKKQGGCRLILLFKSNHIVLWDFEAEFVQKEILEFLAVSS